MNTVKDKYVMVSSAFAGIYEPKTPQTIITFEPNPVYDQITLDVIGNTAAYIQITDLKGQVVSGNTYSRGKTRIELSALPAGIYFIKATTAEGTVVKKFVKL